jgi:hypothetical protein
VPAVHRDSDIVETVRKAACSSVACRAPFCDEFARAAAMTSYADRSGSPASAFPTLTE